jgi:hypothetical protein
MPAAATAMAVPATPKLGCRRCGGPINKLAQTCVDCGARALRLRPVPDGCAVLVTGPGAVADKLDGASHAALVKLLDELPAHEASFTELRKKPPRLPFFLADNLDEASAGELVTRLGEIGFDARVERKTSLRPWELRAKVRRMGKRYFWVALSLGGLTTNLTMRGLFELGSVAFLLTAGGWCALIASTFVFPALAYRKPLVMLAGDRKRTGETPLDRLAGWLPRLTRRSDRRLVGRIIDRLQLSAGRGAGDVAAVLAERGALACQGLVAIADRIRHLDEAELRRATPGGDDTTSGVAVALDRLREGERVRAVIAADLLRVFSRADQLCVRAERIATLGVAQQTEALARELEDTEREVAAEEDVAALLS